MRILCLLLLSACNVPSSPDPPAATPEPSPPPPPSVDGWEGFFPPADIDQTWLDTRGLPFQAAPLRAVLPRVAKLVIADGPRHASAQDLQRMQEQYCVDLAARAWNQARCDALEQRKCREQSCAYEHFGNCSGLLAGGGWFITAAHCTAGLVENLARRGKSAILLPGPDGLPASSLALGEITPGKSDWEHHWVALDDHDPVDAAAVSVEDGGLEPMARAVLPELGAPLFLVGYPRVEGRSDAARQAAGYEAVPGTPSASFGRLADANREDKPLCNVDGMQEHWALQAPCPSGEVGEGAERTWKGVILNSPFLTTYDSVNGYSGAPVFDQAGRWVGVNTTLISDTNPQDAFLRRTRMVAIPVQRVLSRLEVSFD